ncbi:FadR/GntR family transcriptional regulator [Nonomuraea rubra]|uniref:DNA-binding FadR family transcriptional regulator n=1 Tax=Nonomuraea rubra TaxID=46180 RepID=A0A7X0U055_9ACTN|nr:FadR/GntR family transcriptional regulator [Nonomuraea rubra]MBB6550276.1 DNA-binding FadR family transcriptional regulator [Nonomuraea rubra]
MTQHAPAGPRIGDPAGDPAGGTAGRTAEGAAQPARRSRRVRPAKLGTTVVEQLVDDIVRGVLRPGSALPPEGELCEEFGVSRTVIRESVKIVQEKGLVRIEHGRGTQVMDPRQWNLLDDVVLTSVIAHDENATFLDELVSVRTALEADMAAAAARFHTAQDDERIAAELGTMRASLESPPDFGAADVRFHDMIMAASGNRLGRAIVNSIHDKARTSMRYHGEYNDSVMRRTLEEHQAISDAIVAGDPEGAAAAMRRHILDSWNRRRPAPHG